MGGAHLVTWTVLCIQFHAHRHFNNPRPAVTFKQLLNRLSVHDLRPSNPSSFAQIEIDASAHARTFTKALKGPLRPAPEIKRRKNGTAGGTLELQHWPERKGCFRGCFYKSFFNHSVSIVLSI